MAWKPFPWFNKGEVEKTKLNRQNLNAAEETIVTGIGNGEIALPISVVSSSVLPSAKGYVPRAAGSSSNAVQYQPPLILDAHEFGKGDSSQDELAHLKEAIEAVQARVNGIGGGVGAIDLGSGIWKLSGPLVLPSNVGLVSSNGYGFGGYSGSGAQIQPWSEFEGFLVRTASEAKGCILSGIRVFINNSFLTISGVQWNCSGGLIKHCSISNSYLKGLEVSGADNQIAFNFIEGWKSRNETTWTTLGTQEGALHVATGSIDNEFLCNEISGGAVHKGIGGNAVRQAALYHCATYNIGSGGRWIGNLHENGDLSFCQQGQHNLLGMERIEWSCGHGLRDGASSAYNTYNGTYFTNNGLGQNDRYYHHLQEGNFNNYSGSQFFRDSNAAAGENNASTCIYDFTNGAFINYYDTPVFNTSSWVSSPWVVPSRSAADRSDIRASSDKYSRFISAPTTGNFTIGETYRVGGPVQGASLVTVIVGSGTLGSLSGVTGTTVSGTNEVVLNSGKGKEVPLGSFITVAGVVFTTNTATLGNQVIAKNGDTLTLGGTAGSSVSSAAVGFNGVGTRATGSIVLSGASAATPGKIAAATQTSISTISLSGSALGNRVDASYGADLQGVQLLAWVSSSNTISYAFRNGTAGEVTLSNSNVNVWVRA